ncbi:hypothetical protein B2904_orf1892 [Brachyspira pilosicoli B2904]|uniref:Lipoprotein n=1 Tax=Brachyspira pilosicoli B2904 TaxID=1133568 RepID=J9TZ74_BRAPL|nr:hypothetical protein [Brachyspira pilosicoli]AFR71222.1 hypothetical protein B2904_orf1892 [Brachyspira pilosicoli B2904]
MKNTLLALMLVSSLFVISCGADATKPTDAYKSQKTEISSGTKKVPITASSTTVDVSTFALPGEKVTEILEVSGDTGVDKAVVATKNPDGGIYQFTTTANASSVTYKYSKSAIAPIKEATTTATATAGGSSESTATVTDPTFSLLFEIVSVTYQGSDITANIKSISGNKITFSDYNQTLNGQITIKYQYMDVYQISEKPTKEGTIEATDIITLTQNDAGKTYVCKDINMGTYYYGIVPADGIIPSKSLSGAQQNNDYQLWLY